MDGEGFFATGTMVVASKHGRNDSLTQRSVEKCSPSFSTRSGMLSGPAGLLLVLILPLCASNLGKEAVEVVQHREVLLSQVCGEGFV